MNRVETPVKTSAVRCGNTSLFGTARSSGSSSHDFGEDQGHYENTTNQRLANFEKCRKSLPAAIPQLLDLEDFDLLAALDTTGRGSDAVKSECKGQETSACSPSGPPLLSVIRAATLIHAHFAPVAEPVRRTVGEGSRDSPAISRSQSRRVSGVCNKPRRDSATAACDIRRGPRRRRSIQQSLHLVQNCSTPLSEVVAAAYGELKSAFLATTTITRLQDACSIGFVRSAVTMLRLRRETDSGTTV